MSLHTIPPEKIKPIFSDTLQSAIAYITSLGFKFRYNTATQQFEYIDTWSSSENAIWNPLTDQLILEYGYRPNTFNMNMVEMYTP